MKSFTIVAVLVLAAFCPATASEASPIEKIVQMISDLQAKVIAEGTEAQKVYDEHAEWCEDRSKNLGFEIKTGTSDVAELKATIEEETPSEGTPLPLPIPYKPFTYLRECVQNSRHPDPTCS